MMTDLKRRPRFRGAARLKQFRERMSRATPDEGAFRQVRKRGTSRLTRFLEIARRGG